MFSNNKKYDIIIRKYYGGNSPKGTTMEQFDGISDIESKRKKLKKGWIIGGAMLILLAVVLVFVLFRFEDFQSIFVKMAEVFEPILYGVAIAYLLNPIMVFFEKLYALAAKKIFKVKTEKYKKAGRNVAITLTVIVLFAIVYILFSSVLPQLYKTIMSLINAIPEGTVKVKEWYETLKIDEPEWMASFGLDFDTLIKKAEEWFVGNLSWIGNTLLTYITSGVKSAVSFVANTVIGVCVTVYLLAEKNTLFAHLRKSIYALCKKERADNTVRICSHAKEIFNGYIYGNVVGCLIVFASTFVFMKIMGMDYAILISTIVGVTNFIPFFGPFIGAVPSIFILLINNPMDALTFTIFTLVLQQVEGHFLTPLIISDQTGVSPFWVTVVLLVGAGFFGITGLILSVPVFSVIYYIVKEAFEKNLGKKSLPIDTTSYLVDSDFDTDGMFAKLKERRRKTKTSKKDK